MPNSAEKRIIRTDDVLDGCSRIKGTRVRVMDIVQRHEDLNESPEEMAEAFQIPLEDINEALRYYKDNREEIKRDIREHKAFVRKFRHSAIA